MNMRLSEALNRHRAAIRRIAEDHRAANPRVFGSVARGEDTEASDIDIPVDAREGELPPGIRDRVLREAKPI